jgi:hypothetical protein
VAPSTIEEDNRHLRLLHEAQIDSISFSVYGLGCLPFVIALNSVGSYGAAVPTANILSYYAAS